MLHLNTPERWLKFLPIKEGNHHKYDYGHAAIYSATQFTGATRLAACAAARIGAGLVTVLSCQESFDVYRNTLPAHIMVRDDLKWVNDTVTSKLYGCGGLPVEPDWDSEIPTVLDASSLHILPKRLSKNFILTPHEGEFAKAFHDVLGHRIEKATAAAKTINAYIVLKGSETAIIAPDGTYVVNSHSSPFLATAGSGDVLAGIIMGLIAQKMPLFEACCAAVWIHGECARKFGIGLVASDLINNIPVVLKDLVDSYVCTRNLI